jgi:lipoprotein-releasing system permease protein
MLGLVLAIGLLITVMSVMNGFDKEMRERILVLVPHVTLYSYLPMDDWQATAAQVAEHPDVVAVAPFVRFDALFMNGSRIETAGGIGLDIDREIANGQITTALSEPDIRRFAAQRDGLILGAALAAKLGVSPGERLTLIVPSRAAGLEQFAPRSETVVLSAVLESGTELDQEAALVHLSLASRLAGLDGAVSGLRLATRDIFAVPRIGWEVVNRLAGGHYVSNWMNTHGNLYAAIQLSRDLISLLLFSIIAVAAFNVVSSLVLVVFDKRGDIAILRTLGASPADIAWVFVLQGAMIGLVGVVIGLLCGALLSVLVPDLVGWLEQVLNIRFLDTDVYPVSFLPVDLRGADLALVGGVAFLMCVLAAVYPAFRAARLAPATVLHQD